MVEVKARIGEIEQYTPGGTVEETARAYGLVQSRILKLASNENPRGPSKAAFRAILESARSVNIYPTADATHLRSAIQRNLGGDFEVENIVCGNGSDGVLEALVHLFIEEGDDAIIPIPTFSFYELVLRMHGGNPIFIMRDRDFGFMAEDILEKATDCTKIVFIASPNNPTGNSIDEGTLRELLERMDALIVVDEAYVEFSSKQSFNELVLENDNLVVTHTFSKAYGLAGLRVGYGVIPRWLFGYYMRATPPFAVNTLAERAAIAALEDREDLEETRRMVEEGRRYLASEIPFRVYPSDANFVLVDISPFNSVEVVESLKKQGVIVRDCSSFSGMSDSFIRITVGREEENKRVVEGMKGV